MSLIRRQCRIPNIEKKYPMSLRISLLDQFLFIYFRFFFIVRFIFTEECIMHENGEWQMIFISIAQTMISIQSIEITDNDNATTTIIIGRSRFMDSKWCNGSFDDILLSVWMYVCVLRIWNSTADPSNYTDNIASSSSSPSRSLYVIDKLNEPTNWRMRKWHSKKRREPPHCVCVPVWVHSLYIWNW